MRRPQGPATVSGAICIVLALLGLWASFGRPSPGLLAIASPVAIVAVGTLALLTSRQAS